MHINILSAFKEYLSNIPESKIIFSYNDGRTTVTATDGTSIVYYSFPNFLHDTFYINLSDIKNIKLNKNMEANIVSNNIEINNKKKKYLIQGALTNPLEIPTPPKKYIDIHLNQLYEAYKKIAQFNSAFMNNCDIVIGSNKLIIREFNSVFETDININCEPFSIDFRTFAHILKLLNKLNEQHIRIGFSKDLYIFSNTVVIVTKYNKVTLFEDTPDEYFRVYITEQDEITFMTKNGILYINDTEVAPCNLHFKKVIRSNQLKSFIKKYGNELLLNVHKGIITISSINKDARVKFY